MPQFIDVEDKIIGPITVRQFIIMLAGFILIAICYALFDFSLFLTVAIFLFGLSITFAFVKVNGLPFHLFVLSLTQTIKRPSLRVWNQLYVRTDIDYGKEKKQVIKSASTPNLGHLPESKLAELSLIVDTRGAFPGEADERLMLTSANPTNQSPPLAGSRPQ